MENNTFTPKLYDVMVPSNAFENVLKLKSLFFIMENVPFNLDQVMQMQ